MEAKNREPKRGIFRRLFFAFCMITGATGCIETLVNTNDGDTGTIVNATTCWRLPGGKNEKEMMS